LPQLHSSSSCTSSSFSFDENPSEESEGERDDDNRVYEKIPSPIRKEMEKERAGIDEKQNIIVKKLHMHSLRIGKTEGDGVFAFFSVLNISFIEFFRTVLLLLLVSIFLAVCVSIQFLS
jgi:hypothetical protein